MNPLSGFDVCKRFTIAHTADGAQTNYQMKLTIIKGTGTSSAGTLYLDNKSTNWPYDIRFTNAAGTELHFWREESDATDGTWWIEVDSIPAHPDDFVGYVHVGDADAADESNGPATFPFFDHFDGDLSKWSGDTASFSIASSVVTGGAVGVWKRIFGNVTTGSTVCAVRGFVNFDAGYSQFGLSQTDVAKRGHINREAGTTYYIQSKDGTTESNVNTNPTIDALSVFDVICNAATNVRAFDDGVEMTGSPKTTNPPNSSTMAAYLGTYGASVLKCDWVLIRKYTVNEPTWGTWGGWEAYKDIATRFKLIAQTFRDIPTRFKITVQGYSDKATRFKTSVLGYADVGSRFSITSGIFKDIATRFKLSVQGYKDVATRARFAVQGYSDKPTRFLIIARSYKDVGTRFKISALAYKDIGTRFRTAVRVYKDIGTRFRLFGSSNKDIGTRFAVRVITYTPPVITRTKYRVEIRDTDGIMKWAVKDIGPGSTLNVSCNNPAVVTIKCPVTPQTSMMLADMDGPNELWVWKNDTLVFTGPIVERNLDHHGTKVITLDAMDYMQQLKGEYVEYYDALDSCADHVAAYLAQQVSSTPVFLGTIEPTFDRDITVERDYIYTALMNLRKTVGGYIQVDPYRKLNWYYSLGQPTGQQIRYHKNMTGMSEDVDWHNFGNKLYVYGDGIDLTTGGVYPTTYIIDAASIAQYKKTKVMKYTEPSIVTPATLLEYAKLKIQETSHPKKSYVVDLINLADYGRVFEELSLGSVVTAINTDINVNVDVQIVRLVSDLYEGKNISVELSTSPASIVDFSLAGHY